MKNIDAEDTLRPEYDRSNFGELVRGKYATTQVDFQQLTGVLLACIGEDEAISFEHHSVGNYLAQQSLGKWTYEIDNANQITLRYWVSEFGSIEVTISNPTCVGTPKDRTELQDALREGVMSLKRKVAAQQNRP
ncbi:MAG TPA: hypothetical protein VJU86_21135 [Pyrinomonadaceae bacterium]|nr:hypothetical protein [Pyrinomonadaceae bacterium]